MLASGKMDGHIGPMACGKTPTLPQKTFWQARYWREKAATRKRIAFATVRLNGNNRARAQELAIHCALKKEEGRRARPRIRRPSVTRSPPTWVCRDVDNFGNSL